MVVFFDSVDAFLERQEICYIRMKISRQRLRDYLCAVEKGYNDLPYHGVWHVKAVLDAAIELWEMAGGLGGALRSAPEYEVLALAFVVAAAVHDLAHDGLSNKFLVHSGHRLAIRHNDLSPNESNHLVTAFELMARHNFVAELPHASYRVFRETVLRSVMATDMARHHGVLEELRALDSGPLDIRLLLSAGLKCADLTHVFQDFSVQRTWAERLAREHAGECGRWRQLGLEPPVEMVMANDGDFAASQLIFLKSIVMPFIEAVRPLLPGTVGLLEAARRNANAWHAELRARHRHDTESGTALYESSRGSRECDDDQE